MGQNKWTSKIFTNFAKPFVGSFEQWIQKIIDEKIIVRIFKRDDDEQICEYYYVVHYITLADGKIMLGLMEYSEFEENSMYPYITYYRLGEIDIAISNLDQDDMEQ